MPLGLSSCTFWEDMEDLAMEVPKMLELAIVPRQVRWTWTKRIVSAQIIARTAEATRQVAGISEVRP